MAGLKFQTAGRFLHLQIKEVMRTITDEQLAAIKPRLSQISESAKLAKAWLEIISSNAKIAESDRQTCKGLSIQMDVAERNADDIKNLIAN
jgi:hypothetical protein